jgi:hypothetical protein
MLNLRNDPFVQEMKRLRKNVAPRKGFFNRGSVVGTALSSAFALYMQFSDLSCVAIALLGYVVGTTYKNGTETLKELHNPSDGRAYSEEIKDYLLRNKWPERFPSIKDLELEISFRM